MVRGRVRKGNTIISIVKKGIIVITLILILLGSGCRLSYLIHAGAGQFRLLYHSIRVEEAIQGDSLSPEQKDRLRLVARIKDFGEKELGLKKTKNYQKVYLKSHHPPIYTVSAAPKDRLIRITWWFPVVGNMPYLAFFDLESAMTEKNRLLKKSLDVTLGVADAYSTLGWFKDPVTLNLIEGSTVDLVDTILHEMTHTTLYAKGQGEFNEGIAVLVGKVGALFFLERNYGPAHPFTIKAKESIEDERIFSSFLASLLNRLEHVYDSPLPYQQKLTAREEIFLASIEGFNKLKDTLQTGRFTYFGRTGLNNAYLLSVGLYHRHFHLFEAVLRQNGNSFRKTLAVFRTLAREKGDLLEKTRIWLDTQSMSLPEHRGPPSLRSILRSPAMAGRRTGARTSFAVANKKEWFFTCKYSNLN
jgi:predicted aminopeptidase